MLSTPTPTDSESRAVNAAAIHLRGSPDLKGSRMPCHRSMKGPNSGFCVKRVESLQQLCLLPRDVLLTLTEKRSGLHARYPNMNNATC